MTVTFGTNISPPVSYNGIKTFRDLAVGASCLIIPWGFTISSFGVSNPELAGDIPPLDIGLLPTDPRPGAAFGVDTLWSGLTFTVDHKKFAATAPAFDGSKFYITEPIGHGLNGTTYSPTGSQTRGWGRYSGWSGTAPTFSDGGTDGYAEFPADDTVFNCYSYGPSTSTVGGMGAGAIYYKIEVESGTFEVWDGNPASGGTYLRDITSADNATERLCDFDINKRMYIRRKSGVANSRLRSYKCYVKGSDCTGFTYPISSTSEGVRCSLTTNPLSNWTKSASSSFAVTLNTTTGTGYLDLSASTSFSNSRSLTYTGLGGVGKFPAGGIILSAKYPDGIIYGKEAEYGPWSKVFVDDLKAMGARYVRTLDFTQANCPAAKVFTVPSTWLVSYSTVYQRLSTLNARALAVLANVAELDSVWVNIPHAWDQSARRAYLAELYQYLNSNVTIIAELSNEPWNTAFGQNFDLTWYGRTKGGWHIELADRTHELLDDCQFVGGSGWAGRFKVAVNFQTAAASSLVEAIFGRAYLGAGSSLRTRLGANAIAAFAPYFGGGVTRTTSAVGMVSYTIINTRLGGSTGYTQTQYYNEIASHYPNTQDESRLKWIDLAAMIAANNSTYSGQVVPAIYEINRHGFINGDGSADGIAYNAAMHAYEQSPAMAAFQKKHLDDIAAATPNIQMTWYLGPGGRVDGNANGYWGIAKVQGERPGTDSWQQVCAFGQAYAPTPTVAVKKSARRQVRTLPF